MGKSTPLKKSKPKAAAAKVAKRKASTPRSTRLKVTKPKASKLTFRKLVQSIHDVHEEIAVHVGRAINISLTLRNWLIGCYIAEYELRGADRAGYGDMLLSTLAVELERLNVSNCNHRQLYRYLNFYRLYPSIVGTLSPKFKLLLPAGLKTEKPISGTVSPKLQTAPQKLVQSLSYSHLELIVNLEDDRKREFYEHECIRANWSVRELRRQINSLYYERSSLSKNKSKFAKLTEQSSEKASPRLNIRDPYIFDFLGMKAAEVMSESNLEEQLLNNLQDFLLELGDGFCFEAKQRRIIIGDTYGFIDLVFYHRVLKCHVLIELKLDEFTHENVGQLNTYVSWWDKNKREVGDNPPIGILLCAQKDNMLVEYALAGMDNKLFVSKYKLHLPKSKELLRELKELIQENMD